jgi:hypothetical protein
MKFWEYLSICKSISVKCGILQEEELSHLSYWKANREVKNKKVTPCMICFIDPEFKPRDYANTDADVAFFSHSFSNCIANEKHAVIPCCSFQIRRHVESFHKGGVKHCAQKGCFVIGKDGQQIGMHQFYAHKK